MSKQTYNEASTVSAEGGEVHIDGPDGVAISFTPEAAAETSDRLLAAAAKAAGQRSEEQRVRETLRLRQVQ